MTCLKPRLSWLSFFVIPSFLLQWSSWIALDHQRTDMDWLEASLVDHPTVLHTIASGPVSSLSAHDFMRNVQQTDNLTESLKLLLEAAVASNSTIENDDEEESVLQARCQRYGFRLSQPLLRRRIFWGSLIADDSWHVLAMAAMEYRDLLHTAVFVESNLTQSMIPRPLRFSALRKQLLESPLLWGHQTKVHVDYFFNDDTTFYQRRHLWRENDQRQLILERWKQNGMTPHDIGFLSDVDEVASRDFLLALSTCHVPEFVPSREQPVWTMTTNGTTKELSGRHSLVPNRPHDCIQPNVAASSVVFEGSPQCLQIPRRWFHPDFIIGACIQGIGSIGRRNATRAQQATANQRIEDWKDHDITRMEIESWDSRNQTIKVNVPLGPLWDATDFRMMGCRRRATGMMVVKNNETKKVHRLIPTGYHFHNFFDSLQVLRRKYATYGHPKRGALEIPLEKIQHNDVGFMVDCLSGRNVSGSKWRQAMPEDWEQLAFATPVAFQRVPQYIELRHLEFQQELTQDEQITNKS